MKLIVPKVEIIPQEEGLIGVYRQIERAGRTCYKSEDKITSDSAIEFTQKMIDNGHTAMLEHGTVYLKVNKKSWLEDQHEWEYMFPENCPWISIDSDNDYVYITTNYRHIVEGEVGNKLMSAYFCKPTEYHEKRVTVRFTCDRGIMAELTRHRVFSFAVESTRFCNYSKNRFNNRLTYIIPSFITLDEEEANSFLPLVHMGAELNDLGKRHYPFFAALELIENIYLKMLKDGAKPQEARAILPNCLKTEVVMTGFVSDWKEFFKLRCAPNAHPDMQILAKDLKRQFEEKGIL